MTWFENLKRIKLESGMSTHEIAEKSGLPEPTLEKIFSGATKSPGINTVHTIVHALGYTLDDLDGSPSYEKESSSVTETEPADDLRSVLIKNFDQLNQEGRERLVETSDDMVSSGKYIKSDEVPLAKAQGA